MSTSYFAACPKGLENLLFKELESLGASELRETVAGVYFGGERIDVYRACLWSRLANKILLPLMTANISDEASLYTSIRDIEWEQHLAVDGTFKVDFLGTDDNIRNTQFGAVRVKDAIVDRFQEREGERPSVNKQNPDLIINVRLSQSQGKSKINVSLDLSGQSLHRRGYRQKQGEAPLKENLACAILIRSGWPSLIAVGLEKEPCTHLIDPMCGSATLLIEGLMIAADIAPGLMRRQYHWGFDRWLQFDEDLWSELLSEAQQRKQVGLDKLRQVGFECRGYDQDWKVLRAAEENIERAGFEEWIRVSCKSIDEFTKPTHKVMEMGLVICNPPYGERLGEEKQLEPVYRTLGETLRNEFLGWKVGVITSNWKLAQKIGLRARKKYKFWNGTLAAELLTFDVQSDAFYKERPKTESSQLTKENTKSALDFDDLSEGAKMVCNRIRKNQKQLKKWLKKESIECYRVYDADIPEYAVAVDVYGESVHVQEYAAPNTIDEHKAIQRFQDCLDAVNVALSVDNTRLFTKQRRQNKGKRQYEKLEQEHEHRAALRVSEGPATFLVNLWSYLDTGLFLDHRSVRKHFANLASGKRVLNLFCYTATATVQAALGSRGTSDLSSGQGGAASSVSVDMSRTYIDWAKQNFEANNINLKRHELVQQDCLTWLASCREGFDVIFLDPPSFSNSKRMESVLDIQRDHVDLIARCMDLLNPNGTLLFSNNLRSFRLDPSVEKKYQVKDITLQTLDPDFQQYAKKKNKIHQCWTIQAT
ncbi:MAG: bifunctional 23S rRNA (guanine(2069)-N(7))-methyltransferase RlmK/23S rRNA (guanine(2445)-N(2))-methyltransferase RlmL [Cellvibrionaceae bacterium]